jgi:hypothetical protein
MSAKYALQIFFIAAFVRGREYQISAIFYQFIALIKKFYFIEIFNAFDAEYAIEGPVFIR